MSRLPPFRPWLALAVALVPIVLPAPASSAPRLTRERIEAALAGSPPFRFVYGTLEPARTAALREQALHSALRLYGADSSRVAADRDVAESDLAASGLVLFGSPRENDWTRRLADRLPVRFTEVGFRWQGAAYERPGDAIVLAWPNPLAPGRFLVLAAGNSPAASAGLHAWLPAGEDWRITRGGERVRSGRFAQSEAAPWRYDPALDRDLEVARERFAASLVRRGEPAFVVRAAPGLAAAAPAFAAGTALLARLDAMGLAAGPRAQGVTLTLYGSLEQKGLLARDTRPGHVAAGAAHAAIPAGREAPELWPVAAARLVSLGASERSRFLEPAGVWLSGRFEGEPLERAVARLYDGRLLPTAADAATRDAGFRSPLVRVPARSLLARAVFECAASPRSGLLALLSERAAGSLDSLCAAAGARADRVASRYRRLADSLARTGRPGLSLVRPRPWRPADGFQRGACLAHAASLEDGYLSASAASALREIRGLHADWVTLTPYGYLPESGAPAILASARGGPDEESDEAIAEAAARARALGLRVWLSPRLWSRGGPGGLRFTSAEWPRFLAAYRELMLHWALLAERERIDGLVVGCEMAGATLRHPGWWRGLIADVRAVYTGTLTYQASLAEAPGVPFWDALDLVGLSFDVEPGEGGALRSAAAKALEGVSPIARRAGRPVLVEAGYPALAAAAPGSRAAGRGTPDEGAQLEHYRAATDAFDRPDWLAGVTWWTWPSGVAGVSAADAAFSPRGRPAEAAVREAFGRWEGRPVHVPR